MACGRALMSTCRWRRRSVVGNDPVPAVPAPAELFEVLLHDATSSRARRRWLAAFAASACSCWSSSIGLRRTKCARCDTRRWCPTNRPSSEDRFRRCRTGVRARPPRGHHRCGTAPGSHRLRWAYTTPAATEAPLRYPSGRDARHRSRLRDHGATSDGRDLVEADGSLERGGGADHHQVGVLGPDELDPDGKTLRRRARRTPMRRESASC